MTGGRLRYGFLLAGLCLLYLFLPAWISWYLLVFFLLLPLPSLALGSALSRRVSLTCDLSTTRVEKGEPFCVRLRVHSPLALLPTRLVVDLALSNELMQSVEHEQLIVIAGTKAQPVTLEQTVSSPLCGKLSCQIAAAAVCDPLSLARFCLREQAGRREGPEGPGATGSSRATARQYPAHSVLVMPALRPLPAFELSTRPLPDAENDGRSTVVPGDDPCELYDLRDYQPGDRLSRIHWKLSDKYDRLMVKEYGRVVASDALITFDLNADAPEIDALMDTLCSLASFFREQGQACEVAWYDGVHQAQARAKAASTDEWEALIAAILSGGRAQAAPLVLRELAQDPTRAHFRNLVCLCGELGLAGAELAELRARMAGSDPRIIVLTQENTGRKDGAHELALG